MKWLINFFKWLLPKSEEEKTLEKIEQMRYDPENWGKVGDLYYDLYTRFLLRADMTSRQGRKALEKTELYFKMYDSYKWRYHGFLMDPPDND